MGRETTFIFKADHPRKRGVTYVLLFWSMGLVLLLSVFFGEGIALFSEHPFSWMNDTQFFLTFAATLLAILGYFILARRNFRIGIEWGWVVAFLGLFVANAIGTFSLPYRVIGPSELVEGGRFEIAFTLMQRVRFVCSFGVACLLFYCFYAVFPKVFHNIRRLHIISYVVVLASLASIVYSFIAESRLYASMFDPKAPWLAQSATSFTNNPNIFAIVILFGIIACCILHCRYSRWFWYPVIFFFGVFQLILGSGSGIVCSWLLITGFMTYRFLMTVRQHPSKSSFWLVTFFFVVILFSIFMFSPVLPPSTFLRRLGTAISSSSFSITSMASRVRTWRRIIDFLGASPIRLFFGAGEGQAMWLLGAMEPPGSLNGIYWAHNGFFQLFLNGGIVRLATYLLLIGRFIYVCVDGVRRRSRVSWPCLMGMMAILVRSFFESTSFLALEGKGVVIYLLLILPVEVDHFLGQKPEVGAYEDEILAMSRQPVAAWSNAALRMPARLYFLATPVFVAAVGVLPQMFFLGRFTSFDNFSYYAVFAAVYLLAPLGLFSIGHLKKGAGRKAISALYVLFALAVAVIGAWFSRQGYAIPLSLTAVFLGLTMLSFLFGLRGKELLLGRFVRRIAFPHYAIAIVSVIGCYATRLIPEGDRSFYNVVMLASIFACFYAAFIYSKAGFRAHPVMVFRVENLDLYLSARGIRHERQLDSKQEDYLVDSTPYETHIKREQTELQRIQFFEK